MRSVAFVSFLLIQPATAFAQWIQYDLLADLEDPAPADSVDPDWALVTGEHLGSAVAMADFDADGLDDAILAGAAGKASGGVFLAGAVLAFDATTGVLLAEVTEPTPSEAATFGSALAVGDVDGGAPELLVGAFQRDVGSADKQGMAFLFTGLETGSPTLLCEFTEASGDADGVEWFGEAVALADLDGDLLSEILVSAPRAFEGRVYVYDDDCTLIGSLDEAVSDGEYGFGTSLAVGQLDSDTEPELVVGNTFHLVGGAQVGVVEVFDVFPSGTFAPVLVASLVNPDPEPEQCIFDPPLCSEFPGDVLCADLDGDGADEILSSNIFQDQGMYAQVGRVYVHRLDSSALVETMQLGLPPGQEANRSRFGYAIAAGDADGDGDLDLFLSAPSGEICGSLARIGAVYVFEGQTGRFLTRVDDPEVLSSGFFGSDVATARFGAGPVHLIVGAPEVDCCPDMSDADDGRVAIFEPKLSCDPVRVVAPDPQALAGFGREVVAVGDVTGDMLVDFVVGEPGRDDVTTIDAGRAYLFTSPFLPGSVACPYEPPLELKPVTPVAGGQFGFEATSGDFNGNGFRDIAVAGHTPTLPVSFVRFFFGPPIDTDPPDPPGGPPVLPDGLYDSVSDMAETLGVAGGELRALAGDGDLDGDACDGAGSGDDLAMGLVEYPEGEVLVLRCPLKDDNGDGIIEAAGVFTLPSPTTLAPEERAGFGTALDVIPDVEADGADDLAIGAPDAAVDGNAGEGRVFVYLLSPNGVGDPIVTIPPAVDLGALDPLAAADSFEGRFGSSVSADDFDMDGIPDVIIGAPGVGKVFVRSSLGGPFVDQLPLLAPPGGPSVGGSVAGAGEIAVAGGYAPLALASAPLAFAGAGVALALQGPTAPSPPAAIPEPGGAEPGANFGFVIDGAGDVDLDAFGRGDGFIVGQGHGGTVEGLAEAGEAYIFPCLHEPGFASESDCANGLDDDGDGAIDCHDVDCAGPACPSFFARTCGAGAITVASGYDPASGLLPEQTFPPWVRFSDDGSLIELALAGAVPVLRVTDDDMSVPPGGDCLSTAEDEGLVYALEAPEVGDAAVYAIGANLRVPFECTTAAAGVGEAAIGLIDGDRVAVLAVGGPSNPGVALLDPRIWAPMSPPVFFEPGFTTAFHDYELRCERNAGCEVFVDGGAAPVLAVSYADLVRVSELPDVALSALAAGAFAMQQQRAVVEWARVGVAACAGEPIEHAQAVLVASMTQVATLLPAHRADQVNHKLEKAIEKLDDAQTHLTEGKPCKAAKDVDKAARKVDKAIDKTASFPTCPGGPHCVEPAAKAATLEVLDVAAQSVDAALDSTCAAAPGCAHCAPP